MTPQARVLIEQLRTTAAAMRRGQGDSAYLPRVAGLLEEAARELEQRDALGRLRIEERRWYDTGGTVVHRLDPFYSFGRNRRSLCGLAWVNIDDLREYLTDTPPVPPCRHCSKRP